VEYARDVCGLAGAQHAEIAPGAGELVIVPLDCSLVGHEEAVTVTPGTLAARIIGPGGRSERYHCSYGVNPDYLGRLTDAGLRFSGFDDNGQVRIAELPGHPFFLATLFQPELQDDGAPPHPVIRAFAAAVTQSASPAPSAAGPRTALRG
jgi:CTP synthase (UTP-ammonia lyase)